MRIFILVSLLFLAVLTGFSPDKDKLKMPDYAEKINQIVYQLSCDQNDRQAAKKLLKTYSSALSEYQKEISRLQVDADSFRWSKTYDLMDEFNELSNEILYNSAASRVICDPKFYKEELSEVRQKAILELYDTGIRSLQTGTKKEAKEAYSCFVKAYRLSPTFRDVSKKIQEAKNGANLNVVVEKVAAYADNKNMLSVRFYQTLLNKLQSDFLYDRFINIYSFTEAKQRKIDPADWIVRISFIDFERVKAATLDNTRSFYLNGVADVRIFSTIENKEVLSTRIPSQYIWNGYQSSGKSDLQGLFDSFSMSMTDSIFDLLSDFLKQSEY
jgi:hypothetical protein